MGLDYSKIPTEDLEAIRAGQYDRVSTQTLEYIQASGGTVLEDRQTPQPAAARSFTDVLKSKVSGNIPEIMSLTGGALVGAAAVPGPWSPAAAAAGAGLLYGGTKAASRYLEGEGANTDLYGAIRTSLKDVGTGAAMEMGGGLITGALGKLYQAVPKEWAGRLYNSVLKPSTTLTAAEREAIATTALREEIPVTAEGLAGVKAKIKDIQAAVDLEIQNSAYKGNPISTADVVQRLQDLKQFYSTIPGGRASLTKINKLEQDLLATHGQTLSVAEANQVKKNIYRELGDASFGELKAAEKEAKKQIARGLKEELEKYLPEIQGLNKRQGELLDLEGALEKAVARLENREIMGITDWIASGTAGVAGAGIGYASGQEHGASSGAAIGLIGYGGTTMLVKKALMNPTTLSEIAQNMSRATGGKVTPAWVNTRLAAYLAMKAADQENSVEARIDRANEYEPR